MESLLGKTDEYGYDDVIINPYLADARTAIGKLCFFSNSPRDVIIVANEYKVEAKILKDIKDGCFIDKNGTKWDCIIVSRDKPEIRYSPFKTPSQFISAYKQHRDEDPKSVECHQLASLGGIWLKSSKHNFCAMVVEVYSDGIVTRPDWGIVTWDELCKIFVFPDGTPCGYANTSYSSKALSSDEL